MGPIIHLSIHLLFFSYFLRPYEWCSLVSSLSLWNHLLFVYHWNPGTFPVTSRWFFSVSTGTQSSSWASRVLELKETIMCCQWDWGLEIKVIKLVYPNYFYIHFNCLHFQPIFPFNLRKINGSSLFIQEQTQLVPIPSLSGRILISILNTWLSLILRRFLAKWKPIMDWELVV